MENLRIFSRKTHKNLRISKKSCTFVAKMLVLQTKRRKTNKLLIYETKNFLNVPIDASSRSGIREAV